MNLLEPSGPRALLAGICLMTINVVNGEGPCQILQIIPNLNKLAQVIELY
jgi:hypothetical protein